MKFIPKENPAAGAIMLLSDESISIDFTLREIHQLLGICNKIVADAQEKLAADFERLEKLIGSEEGVEKRDDLINVLYSKAENDIDD